MSSTLAVRKKTFGYFLDDHHGDGIVGVAYRLPAPRRLAAQLDG